MSELVDWGVAERVAHLAARGDEAEPGEDALRSAVADGEAAVRSYTGLEPLEPLPGPEWVSRERWASVNLESLRRSMAVVEEGGESGAGLPGPLSGGLHAVLAPVAGAQLGALVGLASRRVLGQYEYPILGGERDPRLLFVNANVVAAERELGGAPGSVLRWIALHEVAHAVHFGAAPWLRGHLAGVARRLLESASLRLDVGELARRARGLAGADPRRVLAEVRAADPISLLAPVEAREQLGRAQTTMAAIEGYAEHVMDAAGPELGEDFGELRAAMERRRSERPPLARLLAWLLGIELKLRQYREGKRFCDGVVAAAGIGRLNEAWAGPESLPSGEELAEPEAWIRRTAGAAV